VKYGVDGRPREGTFLAAPLLGAACADAGRAIIMSTLAPSDRIPRPDQPELLIVPLSADAIACAGDEPASERPPAPAAPGSTRVGGRIQEPKKVRNVNPLYPDSARQQGVQGVVVLEADIAPSGCVSSLKVLRSADPRLDVAGLLAVSRWRYTPTLLNGVPVPVIMTVTVNFRLSQ
jgi:TonB family protein